MQAPPPFQPKKSNTGLIVGLIIGGVLLCCVLPLMGLAGLGYLGARVGGPMLGCGMGVNVARDAVIEYAKAHDGKLPAADTWQDLVRDYYRKGAQKLKDSPMKPPAADAEWTCESDGVKTGIAYNKTLAGKNLSEIEDKSTPLVFESPQTGRNLAIPYEPIDASKSPKIMGNPRGWFVAPVQGEVEIVGGQKNVRFDVGSRRGTDGQ